MADETKARRRVLGLIGLVTGATVGSTPTAAFHADGRRGDLPNRAESETEKRQPRYRETEHVRAFYRTNRS
ncbi:MAG TPA: hypothetical protein VD970_12075 [Acetobacteraceae bacterium]|nr:hypothetical protein [Acetobacteraceae bacterium]